MLLVVLIALSRGDEPAAAVEARSFDLGAVALLAAGLALLLLSKRFPGTVVLAVIALTVTWYQAERRRWRPAGTDREQAEQLAAFLEFARGHSLFAVFWLAANTGIRRSERLGHSTPGFTMATYQHVIPGMQAEAAQTFAHILGGCAVLPASTR